MANDHIHTVAALAARVEDGAALAWAIRGRALSLSPERMAHLGGADQGNRHPQGTHDQRCGSGRPRADQGIHRSWFPAIGVVTSVKVV